LYAYLLAKKYDGTFILRIEDTDKAREVEGSIKHIMESMKWLGINWNFGPDKPGEFGTCLQSERLDIYKKYAEILIEKGLAYPDPFTEDDIEKFREEAKKTNRPFLYRAHRPDKFSEWDGKTPLRFKTPVVKRYEWHDEVRGKLTAGEEMLDDIILIKADGYPTYNFAHIVDDIEMEVTHVMRGEEFIPSTPKYLSIYDALEIQYPKFVTLPPIMGSDGKKKLSKRDGAKDLLEYRSDGYLPEAMCNFLALIGWNPGGDQEIFSEVDLVNLFSLEKIQKSGGAFNIEKLQWMNKVYLEKQSNEFLQNYLKSAIDDSAQVNTRLTTETITKLVPVVFERVHTKSEITKTFEAGEYDWVFSKPDYREELLKWKKDPELNNVLPRLKKLLDLLKEADFSSPDKIKESIWSYADETGRGEVLWPLRVSLSGRDKSPDPFTIAHIIGKEETLARIKVACDKIG
jgi:glutamyl-tRNA synthetase